MYVIAFKGMPVTVRKMHEIEGIQPNYKSLDSELAGYLAAPSAAKARQAYLSWFGFTWKERAKGIDVLAVKVVI